MIISQKQNKLNRFNQLNVSTTFDNQTISNNASFTYIEAFKEIIELKTMIKETISYKKAANSKYTTEDVIDFMIDAVILGHSRFLHMDDLRNDPGYKKIKNSDIPSEKVYRDLLKNLPESTKYELRNLNKKLLSLQAQYQQPREVILDFDDTVCTIFGNQERSARGYNPRYHGRPSFKEKVGIISNTDEITNLTLEAGNHHSNYRFLEFLESCIKTLPKNWYLKRIRADKGFFDQNNFECCENNGYEYIVKAKMQKGVQKIIDYINENPAQYHWVQIDNMFSVTEITIPLFSWSKARRFVIIRKRISKIENDGFNFSYEYQAIVTNIDYLTFIEIFYDYNQRCNIENKIDELKQGFAFDQNSQINHKCNELFLLIKMIACNLHNFFKRTFLPKKLHHHEINTLRRVLYKVPGNIVENSWYRYIQFSSSEFLKKTVSHIRNALSRFRKKVIIRQ